MGGNRGRRQQEAETRSQEAVDYENQRAEELRGQLEQRRAVMGNIDLPSVLRTVSGNAQLLTQTGGVVPTDIDTSGRGFEGYEEFSKTGGFAPGEREQFLRRATAPTKAIYGATRDELSRRKALQGGYMPGFGAAEEKLTRKAAQAGAEASLGGNLELNRQIREGRMAGLGGMERIRAQAEQERLEKQGMMQRGLLAGQEALQRVAQYGTSALSEIDIMDLRNRLQRGQISQADSQLLAQLAAQDKTLFDKITQGISAVGGAAAGVLGAIPVGGRTA